MHLVTSPSKDDGEAQRRQLPLTGVMAEIDDDTTSDDTFTPRDEVDRMVKFFEPLGGLDCDPCWHPASLVRPRQGITRAEDSLTKVWRPGNCWMQPPYSNPGPFLERLADYIDRGNLALGLVKCDFTTSWWKKYIWGMAKSASYPHRRMRFIRQDGTLGTAPFLSAQILWTPDDRDMRRDASKRFTRLYGGAWGQIHKLG